MSAADTHADTDPTGGGPVFHGQPDLTGRVLLARAGAALALVGLVAAAWWWTHPRVFADGFWNVGQSPRPLAEATGYQGLPGLEAGRRDETVTITGYDVHYARNDAGARSRLLVCVPRASYGDSAFGGGDRANLDEACSTLRPVADGTRLRLKKTWPPPAYLVLEVTPTKPGKVSVDEIELSYRRTGDHLFQQGTQRIENTFRLSAT